MNSGYHTLEFLSALCVCDQQIHKRFLTNQKLLEFQYARSQCLPKHQFHSKISDEGYQFLGFAWH